MKRLPDELVDAASQHPELYGKLTSAFADELLLRRRLGGPCLPGDSGEPKAAMTAETAETPLDLASRIAERLMQEWLVGFNGSSERDVFEPQEADFDKVAQVIREVIEAT